MHTWGHSEVIWSCSDRAISFVTKILNKVFYEVMEIFRTFNPRAALFLIATGKQVLNSARDSKANSFNADSRLIMVRI